MLRPKQGQPDTLHKVVRSRHVVFKQMECRKSALCAAKHRVLVLSFFENACQPSERLSALMAKQLIRAYSVSGQVVRCDLVQGVYRALFLSFYYFPFPLHLISVDATRRRRLARCGM